MYPKFKVLEVGISTVNPETASAAIDSLIKERRKSYVCVAPVSTVMDCHDKPDYRQVVNDADLVTPDGMPLVWLARLHGYREVRRTYGPELMQKVCKEGQSKGYRHFFFGGAPGVAERLEGKLKEDFPDLKVTGKYSPPFTPTAQVENQAVVDMINDAAPDILWVGLGSPKQDFWMYKNRDKLDVPVMIGVGAAFDFLSGTKKQAPMWMRRSGLEWLFRFLCEPGRLWKRYMIGNTRFVCLLSRDLIKNKLKAWA